MQFLVIGCGSIGCRHIRNLISIGMKNILAYDTDIQRLKAVKKEFDVITSNKLEELLDKKPKAAFICTPTSLHLQHALIAAENDCHIFIEKPICNSLKGIDKVANLCKKKNLVVLIGYSFRFEKNLKSIRESVHNGDIGKILFARASFGFYLPSWRPNKDYRRVYSSQKKFGGGVILDQVHELDYMSWIMGNVKSVFCTSRKMSSLKMDAEDLAEMVVEFKSGAVGEIHLDCFRPLYERSCEFIGEDGIGFWSFQNKVAKIYQAKKKKWYLLGDSSKNDSDMYVNEIKHFINCILGKEDPFVSFDEGRKSLNIALAAKKSSELKKVILL